MNAAYVAYVLVITMSMASGNPQMAAQKQVREREQEFPSQQACEQARAAFLDAVSKSNNRTAVLEATCRRVQ